MTSQIANKPILLTDDNHVSHSTLGLGMNLSLLALMACVLVVIFVLSLVIGSVNIPLDNVVRVLLGGEADKTAWTNIILKFRLPRALTAVLAGAALAASGLMMQTFFRNPLAGPFILGISSGASLGVALVVLSAGTVGATLIAGIGLQGDFLLAAAAAVGAGLSMTVVMLVARRVQSSTTLLIVGMMMGYLTSALVSLLLYFAIPERIQAYISWTFGSFSSVTWGQMSILAPAVILGLLMTLPLTKALNALLLGEAYARSMGLNVARARLGIITTTAILAGAVTAFCGPIGFLGLAVPHLCRGLFNTSDHRTLLPASMLLGAIVALVAGIIAEVPGSSTMLPLNAVTSFIGAPVVIWVILRQNNRFSEAHS
ncbi:MAG: iron ABC transporter permease [Anaerolineae bacterium]